MNEKIINTLKEYNFVYDDIITTNEIISINHNIVQTEIGDLLLISLLKNNNILKGPIYINISIYNENDNNLNKPLENLEFKLKLIELFNKKNHIIFYYDTNVKYTEWFYLLNDFNDYTSLQKYVKFNRKMEDDYIIFHTKCKFSYNFNYSELKSKLSSFYKNYKTNYKIILLGERYISNTKEVQYHKITTIYEELLELKNNNDVIDLSVDNIYDNLCFETWLNDISIIYYAKYNIIVGNGGHYCTSSIFGRNTIVYGGIPEIVLLNNTDNYYDINLYFKKIHDIPFKKSAYFLSHTGLGDNITNISAVLYLLKYYNTIYFICKDYNKENVASFFTNKNVVIVPVNSKDEYTEHNIILSNINKKEYDLFVSGRCHTIHYQSHITHPELINYKPNNNISVEFDHIYEFYNDIGLDISIYIDYFQIESTESSLNYYHKIQNYNIVFLHTKGSNRNIDLQHMVDLREEYIIICANENMYEKDHAKYRIANDYVNLKIVDYIDIIKNANKIHVIDSCFSCIVYPLSLSKQLKSIDTVIYESQRRIICTF